MPASRDKSQKIAFVYSNLYRIYKKGEADKLKINQENQETVSNRPGLTRVIKVSEADAHDIQSYEPVAFVKQAKKQEPAIRELPDDPEVQKTQNQAITGLKKNLSDLTQVQSRLRFMLKELETLIDDEDKNKKD